MKNRLVLCLLANVALLGAVAMAQTSPPGVMAVTPAELKWVFARRLGIAGIGASQPGRRPVQTRALYTLRLKFPRVSESQAHTHPDSREVTILSGTYATGYGEKFDPAQLKILPAGSFYTEPANVPHYIEIMEMRRAPDQRNGSERTFIRQSADNAR